MSYAPNFELVTELQTLIRRDFPYTGVTYNAPGVLDPNNANPLIDGEWLEFDSASYTLKRGAAGEGTSLLVYPVHTERGRYDVQAIQKVNVLFLGMYEADTAVVDTTGLAIGDLLTVNDVTVGGVANRRGLKERAANTGTVVGIVTKTYGTTQKVRFVHYANVKMP